MNYLNNVTRRFADRTNNVSGLRLDMGERPINFSEADFKKFLKTLTQEDFICYPSEHDYTYLKDSIAALEELPLSHISLGFGSDQIIKSIFDLFSTPYGEVIINDPCFPMYEVYANTNNLHCVKVKYNRDLDFNLESFLSEVRDNTSLVIMANPNSPFGKLKSLDDIHFLCKELENKDVPLLLDEAYIDFGGESASHLTQVYDNLFVCKTFSKAWGAAGSRCGYVISSPFNIWHLEKIRPSFPVAGASLKYINFLISHPHIKKEHINIVLNEKQLLQEKKLAYYDIKYGNVSWIHINDSHDNFYLDKLLPQHNISYKRGLSLPYDSRKNWIRIGLSPGISKIISK
tara:strand:- start:13036 stop:14070 length:1035 start_codon:yes stop_codon:yes gene_type:complete